MLTPPSFAVLDCRSTADFNHAHARHAANIPTEELAQRMHELPNTSIPLTLYADATSAESAQSFLEAKGYQLQQTHIWSETLFQQLYHTHDIEYGESQARLWQAGSLVTHFVTYMLGKDGITAGKGIDIACGSGRDAVYLALNGWHMTGIDYLEGALQRTQQLAQQHKTRINTHRIDLEATPHPFTAFPPNSFDLVVVARYLHRPLLPQLKTLLAPNGILLYQTFMQGAEKYGSPRNPNYLLRSNELASVFSDMKILLNDVHYLEDQRPVSAFIAQRHTL